MKKCLCILLAVMMLVPCLTVGFAAEKGKNDLNITAKGAVLTDMRTGEVLYSVNENKRLYPASITKVMSLILILEALDNGNIKLGDKVTASRNAVSYGGSQIWLKEGESMSVDELLKAVVVASANDACTALGEFVAGSSDAFVAQMNEKAKALGMKNTHFQNCTGLDETETEHYSSAYDIALMSAELMRHERILNYSTIWMDSLRGGETMLVNTNRLVRNFDGCIGLKTGTTTKAGFCVSAVAERDGTRLCAVILGAATGDERFAEATELLNYGFANYETASPKADFSQSGEVHVECGLEQTAKIALAEEPLFTVPKGKRDSVEGKITLKKSVPAPLEKGAVLGRAEFFLEGKCIGAADIVAKEAVARLSFWEAVLRLLRSTVNSNLSG